MSATKDEQLSSTTTPSTNSGREMKAPGDLLTGSSHERRTPAKSMQYSNYKSLGLRRERGVAFVTINHPPMNMLDVPLVNELTTFLGEAERDDAVRVVVFDSADPDYFLSVYDAQDLATRAVNPGTTGTVMSFFQQFVERYRTSPKVSIARIEGRVRFAGNEFVLGRDSLRHLRHSSSSTVFPTVTIGGLTEPQSAWGGLTVPTRASSGLKRLLAPKMVLAR